MFSQGNQIYGSRWRTAQKPVDKFGKQSCDVCLFVDHMNPGWSGWKALKHWVGVREDVQQKYEEISVLMLPYVTICYPFQMFWQVNVFQKSVV